MKATVCLILGVVGICAGCQEVSRIGPQQSPTFFGIAAQPGATRIIYLIDRSGSMCNSIDYVKSELKRCIGEVGEDNEFHIIFFSSEPPAEMPQRRLVAANRRNKRLAYEFIDSVEWRGKNDAAEGLRRAFACRPDMIYLLTDGLMGGDVGDLRAAIDLVKHLNVGGKTVVNTIDFLYRSEGNALKQIAEQNNGH